MYRTAHPLVHRCIPLALGTLATLATTSNLADSPESDRRLRLLHSSATQCDAPSPALDQDDEQADQLRSVPPSKPRPSWVRRTWRSWWLPTLPRVVVPHDPALTLPLKYIRQRQRDEKHLQQVLQPKMQQVLANAASQRSRANPEVNRIVSEMYDTLYGPGLQPVDRQDFLQQYGCTGWTEPILLYLLQLGSSDNIANKHHRGFVEIGAGNGQWARVLNDRYQALLDSSSDEDQPSSKRKRYEFCLAYDNQSSLPLDPQIYNSRTKAAKDYFYDNVRPCDSDPMSVLQQWQCRGRILLLVFPYGEMAYEALKAYNDMETLSQSTKSAATPSNDTVVYVGEGRGGANATDSFFDLLEADGEWILQDVLPVQSFGTKGYEKLYVFKRNRK